MQDYFSQTKGCVGVFGLGSIFIIRGEYKVPGADCCLQPIHQQLHNVYFLVLLIHQHNKWCSSECCMDMATSHSTDVEMSPALSSPCKLLFTITAVGIVILMYSTAHESDVEPVLHLQRREIIYPVMVFPSGTVFQVR